MRSLQMLMVVLCLIGLSSARLHAEEKVYYDVVQKMMEFEFAQSDVMENSHMLTNIFGGRNSKTPAYRAAAEWARDRLKEYGYDNAHLEPYEFGNGWDFDYVSVHMISPDYAPIIAFPTLWSSGSNGKVNANVVQINFGELTSLEDLEPANGKLK